jgi:hypothetical protein
MRGLVQALRMAALFALALATAGCGGRAQLDNAGELQTGEVLVVGRIEVVPPLFPHEQVLEAPLTGRFRGKVHTLVSDRLYDPEESTFSFYKNSTLVDIGREFYLRQPMSKILFYSGGVVVMRATNRGQDDMKLSGGLRYTVKPDDRAVYVGTVRYYRDDYNTITRVEVVDDYARVNQAFVARYGTRLKLRNVRPESVKKG